MFQYQVEKSDIPGEFCIAGEGGGLVYESMPETEARLICAITNDLTAAGLDADFDAVTQDYRWQMFKRIEALEVQVKALQGL